AMALGTGVALTGTVSTYYLDAPSGAAIVLLAIAVFLVLAAVASPLARRRARTGTAAEEESAAEADHPEADGPGAGRPETGGPGGSHPETDGRPEGAGARRGVSGGARSAPAVGT